MKLVLMTTIILLSFSSLVYGNDYQLPYDNVYQESFECRLSQCTVVCYGSDSEHVFRVKGKKVYVRYLPGGSTVFEIESSMGKSQTIIAGANGYLCSINGHR